VNQIARQALVAPARCMLSDISQIGTTNQKVSESQATFGSEEMTVEKAFGFVSKLSHILRDRYGV